MRTPDSKTVNGHGPDSDTSDKSLNILCFDGGGVRGLSSLLILRELLRQLFPAKKGQKPPLPCEIFDMICGTSTGGIIALMLGRLRMSIDEAISSYRKFSETVFGEKKDTGSARYDASKLKEWMEALVAEHAEGGTQAPLLASEGPCCCTFVVAVAKAHANAPPKLFRTYAVKGESTDECTIWEAARATTAAVPFFEAATVGSPPEEFVDGSFSGSNNPSRLAIQEAGDLFRSHSIGCLLSLGTGVPNNISLSDDADEIAKACVELIQSCERVHEEMHAYFKRSMGGEGYVRLSVTKGLESIQLDEWRREAELTGITKTYLRHGEVKDRVEKWVENLGGKVMKVLAAKDSEALVAQEMASLL